MLSQLSYSPEPDFRTSQRRWVVIVRTQMVGLGRIELPTSRLSGVRSNHLSYRPKPIENRRGAMTVCFGGHPFMAAQKLTLTSSE